MTDAATNSATVPFRRCEFDELDFGMMRRGFTLVELVIVVLILGILAAVAVPKVINNSQEAHDTAIAQTLASIREAIDLYRATYIQLPLGTTTTCDLPNALDEFLRGTEFPTGKNGSNAVTNVAGPPTVQPGPFGWVYSIDEGEIIVNSNGRVDSDPSRRYADL